jgi:hypothetical protein
VLGVWDLWRFDLGLWRPGCVNVAVGSGKLLFLPIMIWMALALMTGA